MQLFLAPFAYTQVENYSSLKRPVYELVAQLIVGASAEGPRSNDRRCTSSTKVTRLISCSVETPANTFFSADSRRLVKPFRLGRAPNFRTRPAFDDHFANIVGQIEQLVNRGAAAIAGVVAGIAADVHIKRRLAMFLRSQS